MRRSELDRMLAGEDMPGPDNPPGAPRWRVFDTIAPPHVSPHWTDPESVKHVTRPGWLGVAETEWRNALRSSAMAPPDIAFILRLREISDAAARKAAALGNLVDDEPPPWWLRQSALPNGALSYELRPGGNRPGPAELWIRFDKAVDNLGRAMAERSMPAEQRALERLSLVMHEIADALEEAGIYPWPTSTESRDSGPDDASTAAEPPNEQHEQPD